MPQNPPALVTSDQRLAAYLALLQRVEALRSCPTQEDFLDRLSAHVRELVPFDAVSLFQYESADLMLVLRLMEPPGMGRRMTAVPVDFGPGGRAISTQRPVVLRADGGPAPPIAVIAFRAGFKVIAAVPASTPEAHWGVLVIASRDLEDYPAELLAMVQQVAAAAARALSVLPSEERSSAARIDTPEFAGRSRLLFSITSAVMLHRSVPDVLLGISRLLRETIPHEWASIALWDDAAQGLRRWAAVQPIATELIPEGEILDKAEPPRLAYDTGDVIEIPHEALAHLRTKLTGALIARGVQSGVCLPLKTPRGKYGVLSVGSPRPDAFPIGEILLLWQIAQQLALAIENATYFDRAERYRREAADERDRFKLLLNVNNALVSHLTAHSLWSAVLETMRRTVNHDYARLVTIDSGARELRLEADTYYDARGVMEPHVATSFERSGIMLACERGAPHVLEGAEIDAFDIEGVPAMRSTGLRRACCVPLATQRGMVGGIVVASRREDAFLPPDVQVLGDLAGQVAIAVENTLAFREISDLKNRLAEEKLYLEGEITSQHDFKEIVGTSQALTNVLQQIQTVAPTDATVLLLGETGTGKELLARALHNLSRRRTHPFIRLSAAALPAGLIESELFGYEKGAFTGATQSKAGRLELANRGSLFLDEVGDIPLEVQPKLLRALQEREFERLGGNHTERADVRLIAATNRNLEEMVAGSSFRSDLYYRLSVFPIHVPPLRDRRGDIPLLVRHFAQKFSRAMGRQVTTIPKSTMDGLEQWHWPGNIRELQNVIERAVILSTGSVLQVPATAVQTAIRPRAAAQASGEPKYRAGERTMILNALAESKGVIAGPAGAAARLGLKRTTLHSKMQKLGIKRPTF
jgi:formate hydrogenlyase transcriptional activator